MATCNSPAGAEFGFQRRTGGGKHAADRPGALRMRAFSLGQVGGTVAQLGGGQPAHQHFTRSGPMTRYDLRPATSQQYLGTTPRTNPMVGDDSSPTVARTQVQFRRSIGALRSTRRGPAANGLHAGSDQ